MNLNPVISNNVASVGYDYPTRTLYVTFKDCYRTFEYNSVPAHLN